MNDRQPLAGVNETSDGFLRGRVKINLHFWDNGEYFHVTIISNIITPRRQPPLISIHSSLRSSLFQRNLLGRLQLPARMYIARCAGTAKYYYFRNIPWDTALISFSSSTSLVLDRTHLRRRKSHHHLALLLWTPLPGTE